MKEHYTERSCVICVIHPILLVFVLLIGNCSLSQMRWSKKVQYLLLKYSGQEELSKRNVIQIIRNCTYWQYLSKYVLLWSWCASSIKPRPGGTSKWNKHKVSQWSQPTFKRKFVLLLHVVVFTRDTTNHWKQKQFLGHLKEDIFDVFMKICC